MLLLRNPKPSLLSGQGSSDLRASDMDSSSEHRSLTMPLRQPAGSQQYSNKTPLDYMEYNFLLRYLTNTPKQRLDGDFYVMCAWKGGSYP